MRILVLSTLLGLLTSCLGAGGSAKLSSGGSGPIAPGTPVRWSNASLAAPLDINTSIELFNDFAPADLDGSGDHPIDQMSKQWNGAHSDYTFIKVPSDNVTNKAYPSVASFRDGEMGIYKSHTWFAGQSSALAITQFFGFRRNVGTSLEHIELSHADIILNYRDWTFSTNAADTLSYDLHTVILHELGHLLGTGHSWKNSVMYPFLGITESTRAPTAFDITTINDSYKTGNPILPAAGGGGGFAAYSPVPGEGEEVSGTFELMPGGDCHHTINGEEVLVH